MKEKSIEIQDAIMAFIAREIQEKGYPPSVREIGRAVHLKSTSTVYAHLLALEKKGVIRRGNGKTRAIELVANTSTSQYVKVHAVPFLLPSDQPEGGETHITLPELLCGYEQHFIMVNHQRNLLSRGLLPGDCIVVHRQAKAEENDLVVVYAQDHYEILVQKADAQGYYLAAPDTQEVQEDCLILGRVLSSFRCYRYKTEYEEEEEE